jgi:hypothetical protein
MFRGDVLPRFWNPPSGSKLRTTINRLPRPCSVVIFSFLKPVYRQHEHCETRSTYYWVTGKMYSAKIAWSNHCPATFFPWDARGPSISSRGGAAAPAVLSVTCQTSCVCSLLGVNVPSAVAVCIPARGINCAWSTSIKLAPALRTSDFGSARYGSFMQRDGKAGTVPACAGARSSVTLSVSILCLRWRNVILGAFA